MNHVPFQPRRASQLLALAFGSLIVAACGGGGGSDGGSVAPVTSVSGKAVDGLMSGATVRCVRGGTVVATATTNNDGTFTLSSDSACDTIEVAGGIDVGLTPDDPSDDVARPGLVLRAPAGTVATGLQVTPVTTLIQSLVASGQSVDAARSTVASRLGLGATDPLTADPARDLALYKAGNVVTQIVEQLTTVLAQASGATGDAAKQAIAVAVQKAIADNLSSVSSLATLAADAGSLAADSPLVTIAKAATVNAQASADAALKQSLVNLKPETVAAVAAPLAAEAARRVAAATSLEAVTSAAVANAGDDRAANLVSSLGSLLETSVSAAELPAVLSQVATIAKAEAAQGQGVALDVTIGGQRATAMIGLGLTNYVRIADDTLTLAGAGTSLNATLAQFESSTSFPTVNSQLESLSFAFAQPAAATQLTSTPRSVTLGLEIKDATRTFQAVVDPVTLSLDATGKQLSARIPASAVLTVYAASSASGLKATQSFTNAAADTLVSSADGRFTLNVDALLSTIAASASADATLRKLATDRLSKGTFDVTAVISDLRVGRVTGGVVVPASAFRVQVTGTSAAVAGTGVKGKVRVE